MSKKKSSADFPTDDNFSSATRWHLSTTPLEAAATELEWALLRWHAAFDRYCLHALNLLGFAGITVSDAMILHIVRLHDRPKPASMIASLLNRDDTQNVQYSLRKLLHAGLIEKAKGHSGKNANLTVTDEGRRLCDEFATIRKKLLIAHIKQIENNESRLMYSAKTVSMLTGLYDEVGRTSTAYTMRAIFPDENFEE